MSFNPKIIIALDHETDTDALLFAAKLSPQHCRLKVGKYLFVRYGPEFVRKLIDMGFDVFLDLKFHDIPHTVRQACQAAAELGVWMLNVHCQGGSEMLCAAVEGVELASYTRRPLLLGVTLLTSLSQQDVNALGHQESSEQLVIRYAKIAQHAGLDGVVCSAQEAALLRREFDRPFVLLTPGIRLKSSAHDDQQRVQTPDQAFKAGADYLVVGRPITRASDPVAVFWQYHDACADHLSFINNT